MAWTQRHPALTLAVALAAGISLGRSTAPESVAVPGITGATIARRAGWLAWAAWAGAACLIAAAAIPGISRIGGAGCSQGITGKPRRERRQEAARQTLRIVALVLLGAWRGSATAPQPAHPARDGAAPERPATSPVTVVGTVDWPPIEVEEMRDGRRLLSTQLSLAPEGGGPSMAVRLEGPVAARGGDVIAVTGVMLEPSSARNPGDRDAQGGPLILAKRGSDIRVLDAHPSISAPFVLGRIRGALQDAVLRAHGARHAGFVLAMLTGDRRLLDAATRDALLSTGTYHLLAISGFHVSLVVWILVRLPCPRTARVVFRLGLLAAFTAVTGGNPPVTRAAIMFTLDEMARRGGRCPEPIDTLGASAILLLSADPALLGDVGFQLSFTAVLSILTWGARLRAGPRRGFLRDAMLLSVGTCAGTAPLTALYFQRAHPLGPFWNLLASPLTAMAFLGGILSCALGAIHAGMGSAVAWTVDGTVGAMLAVLELGARIPGSSVSIPSPPPSLAILSIALLVLGLLPIRFRLRLAACATALSASVGWAVVTPRSAEVWVLDAGTGSAAVISLPGMGSVLIDAGTRGNDDKAGAILARAVLGTGNRALLAVCATHFHADHIRGLRGLWARLAVKEFWVSPDGWRSARGLELCREAKDLGASPREVMRGTLMEFPDAPDVSLEVLHPDPADPLLAPGDGNDRSLVLRLRVGRSSVLFLGDLEQDGLSRLLGTTRDIEADVLVAPHHGNAALLWPEILDRVRPRAVVVSGSGRPPAPARIEDLRRRGVAVYPTWEGGAIRMVATPGSGWEVAFWRKSR